MAETFGGPKGSTYPTPTGGYKEKVNDEQLINLIEAGVQNSVGDWLNSAAQTCLLYTSPSPRDRQKSRMPSSA